MKALLFALALMIGSGIAAPLAARSRWSGASEAYGAGYAHQVRQLPGQDPVRNPMLPSQVRFMNVQSGNLPSQIRNSRENAGWLVPEPVQVPQDVAHFASRGQVPQGGPMPHVVLPRNVSAYPIDARVNGQVDGSVNAQVSGASMKARAQ